MAAQIKTAPLPHPRAIPALFRAVPQQAHRRCIDRVTDNGVQAARLLERVAQAPIPGSFWPGRCAHVLALLHAEWFSLPAAAAIL